MDSGKLTYEDGRWHKPSMAELGIPHSVRVAIQSRVGVLPARAQETLKQVTVRTRDWVSARDEVELLQQEAAETRARYEALAQRRARLERVRRVAPVLTGDRKSVV